MNFRPCRRNKRIERRRSGFNSSEWISPPVEEMSAPVDGVSVNVDVGEEHVWIPNRRMEAVNEREDVQTEEPIWIAQPKGPYTQDISWHIYGSHAWTPSFAWQRLRSGTFSFPYRDILGWKTERKLGDGEIFFPDCEEDYNPTLDRKNDDMEYVINMQKNLQPDSQEISKESEIVRPRYPNEESKPVAAGQSDVLFIWSNKEMTTRTSMNSGDNPFSCPKSTWYDELQKQHKVNNLDASESFYRTTFVPATSRT